VQSAEIPDIRFVTIIRTAKTKTTPGGKNGRILVLEQNVNILVLSYYTHLVIYDNFLDTNNTYMQKEAVKYHTILLYFTYGDRES
jgi:hypothetical protein